jgi:hypothetical protein
VGAGIGVGLVVGPLGVGDELHPDTPRPRRRTKAKDLCVATIVRILSQEQRQECKGVR